MFFLLKVTKVKLVRGYFLTLVYAQLVVIKTDFLR